MIKYALGCAEGHTFDSWFPDSDAFDRQRKRGLVACPDCGDTRVEKAIKAPAVVGGERTAVEAPQEVLMDEGRRHARDMMSRLRREIEANTDDVGARFPELARAIHLGDERERAIRGQASLDEARALVEEGIGVMPLPMLADELN
jgi:hypothetical protein